MIPARLRLPLLIIATIALWLPLSAADAKTDLAPTGTLRGIFLGRNPAQATRDPISSEYAGPVPDMLKEIARQIGVPYQLIPAENATAVMDAVNGHAADIGFLAFDETRARVVDFSRPFYLMFNAYLVKAASRFQKSADIDQSGVKVGATTGQSQQIFLSATLKQAKVVQMKDTPPDADMARMLASGEIDAFGQNRQRSEAAAAKFPSLRVVNDNFSEVGQAVVVAKGDSIKLVRLNRIIRNAISSGMVKASLQRARIAGVGAAPAEK